jgi:hypothetical protein
MWKYICTALVLLGQLKTNAQTTLSENLIPGSWYVIRWETENRLLDFEDSLASINYMVDRFKAQHNVRLLRNIDSARIRAELRKVMPAAEALRFQLLFNKDKTFAWKGNNNDTSALYKGTYSVSSNTNEIILTSLDGRTNSYQKFSLKLHAIHPNELVIEIPSEEPGFKQSKFTLKRM